MIEVNKNIKKPIVKTKDANKENPKFKSIQTIASNLSKEIKPFTSLKKTTNPLYTFDKLLSEISWNFDWLLYSHSSDRDWILAMKSMNHLALELSSYSPLFKSIAQVATSLIKDNEMGLLATPFKSLPQLEKALKDLSKSWRTIFPFFKDLKLEGEWGGKKPKDSIKKIRDYGTSEPKILEKDPNVKKLLSLGFKWIKPNSVSYYKFYILRNDKLDLQVGVMKWDHIKAPNGFKALFFRSDQGPDKQYQFSMKEILEMIVEKQNEKKSKDSIKTKDDESNEKVKSSLVHKISSIGLLYKLSKEGSKIYGETLAKLSVVEEHYMNKVESYVDNFIDGGKYYEVESPENILTKRIVGNTSAKMKMYGEIKSLVNKYKNTYTNASIKQWQQEVVKIVVKYKDLYNNMSKDSIKSKDSSLPSNVTKINKLFKSKDDTTILLLGTNKDSEYFYRVNGGEIKKDQFKDQPSFIKHFSITKQLDSKPKDSIKKPKKKIVIKKTYYY